MAKILTTILEKEVLNSGTKRKENEVFLVNIFADLLQNGTLKNNDKDKHEFGRAIDRLVGDLKILKFGTIHSVKYLKEEGWCILVNSIKLN